MILLRTAEAILRGLATPACTRIGRLVCIPTRSAEAVSTSPVGTDSFSRFVHASEEARCLLVFVLVAFPPPPVYVLDNEVQPKLNDIASPSSINSRSACAFLSAPLGSACRHIPSKPFGFGVGRQWRPIKPFLRSPSAVASPRPLPIPTPVTAPLRTATGGELYAPMRDLSSTFFGKIFLPLRLDSKAQKSGERGDKTYPHVEKISTRGRGHTEKMR